MRKRFREIAELIQDPVGELTVAMFAVIGLLWIVASIVAVVSL